MAWGDLLSQLSSQLKNILLSQRESYCHRGNLIVTETILLSQRQSYSHRDNLLAIDTRLTVTETPLIVTEIPLIVTETHFAVTEEHITELSQSQLPLVFYKTCNISAADMLMSCLA